jgi:methionyl-tRNA formyltransferase
MPSWSLIEGSVEHVVTLSSCEWGIDEGDVLGQRSFALAADDTALTLNAKCLKAGIACFAELVERLEDVVPRGVAQNL